MVVDSSSTRSKNVVLDPQSSFFRDVEAGEQISCSIESVVEAVATAFEEQLNSEISKAVKSKEEILPRPKQFTQQPQQNVIKVS